MKKWSNILIAGSSLFFLETAYEMYVLTNMRGPQMLGFSIIHIAPGFALLVFLSALIYLSLAMFAFVILVMRLVGKFSLDNGYAKFMLIVLIVQVIHTSLLLTYNKWVMTLFPNGGG
jgi:hypothetical protein